MDGGKTWELLDSTNNVDATGRISGRDRRPAAATNYGATSFQIIVDPTPVKPPARVIVYLAGSDGDLAEHRQRAMPGQLHSLAGDATNIVLVGEQPLAPAISRSSYGAIEGDRRVHGRTCLPGVQHGSA